METFFHISTLIAFSLHQISKQCYPDQGVCRTNVNNSQYWSLFTDVCIVVVVSKFTDDKCNVVSYPNHNVPGEANLDDFPELN